MAQRKNPKLPPDHLSYLAVGINCDAREIRLVGPVDDDMVRILAQGLALMLHTSYQPILVFITSGGGDEDCGLACLHMLQSCPAEITTVATGCVESAALDIWQGGDSRLVMPLTSVMMHAGSIEAIGSPDTIANAGRFQTRRRQLWTQFYAGKSGKPKEDFAMMLSGSDFYMLPDEAIAAGLADGYYPEDLDDL